MFLEVGMHAFQKASNNSTKNDIEQDFSTQWLSSSPKSMINFKFDAKTPFINIFVTLHLDKGHNQSINRHSGPDGVCYGQLIYWCELNCHLVPDIEASVLFITRDN